MAATPKSQTSFHEALSSMVLLHSLRIPGELWVEIAFHLDALSVMALSETSREMHLLLSAKSVWAGLLRSLIQRQGPFISSYSIDSMNVQELQRAAAGPRLYRRLGQVKAVQYPELPRAKGLDPRVSRLVHPSVSFLCFVPGGRFVATLNVADAFEHPLYGSTATVALWDIGPLGDAEQVKAVPISQYDVDPGVPGQEIDYSTLRICIIGESCLRIAVSHTTTASSQEWRVIVLQCSLDTQDKSLSLIGTLDFEGDGFTQLVGGQVLMHSSTSYALWNLGTRRATSWGVKHDDGDVAILRDEYVLTITPHDIRVWDISRLEFQALGRGPLKEGPYVAPHVTVPATWPIPTQPFSIVTPVLPHDAHPNAVLFDVFHLPRGPGLSGSAVVRHELKVGVQRPGDYDVSLSVLGIGHLPPGFFPTGEFSNGIVGEPEPLSNTIKRYYLFQPTDATLPVDDTAAATVLALQECPPALLVPLCNSTVADSCPFSGRLVHLGAPGYVCADYI